MNDDYECIMWSIDSIDWEMEYEAIFLVSKVSDGTSHQLSVLSKGRVLSKQGIHVRIAVTTFWRGTLAEAGHLPESSVSSSIALLICTIVSFQLALNHCPALTFCSFADNSK